MNDLTGLWPSSIVVCSPIALISSCIVAGVVIGWFGAEVAVYLAAISPLSALPFCPFF